MAPREWQPTIARSIIFQIHNFIRTKFSFWLNYGLQFDIIPFVTSTSWPALKSFGRKFRRRRVNLCVTRMSFITWNCQDQLRFPLAAPTCTFRSLLMRKKPASWKSWPLLKPMLNHHLSKQSFLLRWKKTKNYNLISFLCDSTHLALLEIFWKQTLRRKVVFFFSGLVKYLV